MTGVLRPESIGTADGERLEAANQQGVTTAAAEVVAPKRIERSLGKARRDIDRRGV